MKIISHRGNKNGPNPRLENNPDYVVAAINSGFDVEVDIRMTNGELYLGHDFGQFKIGFDFLLSYGLNLWIHCKNVEAAKALVIFPELNVFCHSSDSFTISSQGDVLLPPESKPYQKSIIMMPELSHHDLVGIKIAGVITDYPIKYSTKCK